MKIAYIVFKYPTLSQTFIRREIAGLCANGLDVEVHPCLSFGKTDSFDKNENSKIFWLSPLDVLKFPFLFMRELLRQPFLLKDVFGLLRLNRPNCLEGWLWTFTGLFFAVVKAPYFRKSDVSIFHGAWATAPATAAALLSRFCGKPFSFGGHAYDIHRHGGDPFLDWKLRHASLVHTTTMENAAYLNERAGGKARIVLARRGLDQLPEITEKKTADAMINILSVGRLVFKKGHIHQLKACRQLKNEGVPFHLKIAGDGPLKSSLDRQIRQLDLRAEVELCGAVDPARMNDLYRRADIFWHTGIVDKNGDRDGLPNVVPEALAHELAVIVPPMKGVMEAVENERTGLVADITNPKALEEAVKRLRSDEKLRRLLGVNGRAWVEKHFMAKKNAAILAAAFKETPAHP